MTAPAPIPARDLPALAAYSVDYDLEAEAATVEWRFITEAERGKYRRIADAAVSVASLHTAPVAALTPGPPPDARALAGVYWDAFTAADAAYPTGEFPLESLSADVAGAIEAGVLAVVAAALPSVAILDDALRKACEERDKLREGMMQELAEHETFLEELLKNTGDEGDGFDPPEDIAVRYVRHLEAETARLACVVRDIHLTASNALKSTEDREDAEPNTTGAGK